MEQEQEMEEEKEEQEEEEEEEEEKRPVGSRTRAAQRHVAMNDKSRTTAPRRPWPPPKPSLRCSVSWRCWKQ